MNSKVRHVLTAERTSLGFKPADLLGIALMVIPVIISTKSFDTSTRLISFLPWPLKKGTTGIMPDITCGLCAAAFYLALIVRYNIFPKRNLAEALLSTIRAILNCWAIAALISPIISSESKELTILLFKFNSLTLLLMAVILSWLGMRTIAGYSWILFILAALSSWESVAKAMGPYGMIFIIFFAVSLFLQIQDFSHVRDFVYDLKGKSGYYATGIRDNMNAAIDDAAYRTQQAAQTIKEEFVEPAMAAANIPVKKPTRNVKPAYHVGKNGHTHTIQQASAVTRQNPFNDDADDFINMLDLNNDGVVDQEELKAYRSKH